jgi:energy-coupling factor transporter ATP-binding protein EcfA2
MNAENDGLTIRRFQLVQLTLENIGPFRHRFILPLVNRDRSPCTFYLIGAQNGFGKTTLLKTIAGLMWLLGQSPGEGSDDVWKKWLPRDILDNSGSAQLDVLLTVEAGGRTETVLFSICAGGITPLIPGTLERCAEFGVDRWLPVSAWLNAGGHLEASYPDDRQLVEDILAVIREAKDQGDLPKKLHDHHAPLPMALLFPAERRINRPPADMPAIHRPSRLAYDTAHCFLDDGSTWADSLEGLFAWFQWEGDERYQEAADLVNRLMFFQKKKRIGKMDRTRLTPIVQVPDGDDWIDAHPLHELSHGERAMMQLLLRIAAHASGSTVVLIDEMEAHLHYRWKRQLMQVLKDWVNEAPDLTVIVTTHDHEMIGVFDLDRKEGDRLVKGGYLIDERELRGEM